MKVIAAFAVVLACAYFQASSAACTNGFLIVVGGAQGTDQAVMRSNILMTFTNGAQRYLTQPLTKYSKTAVRNPGTKSSVVVYNLDKVSLNLFKPRQICALILDLDPTKTEFTKVNCGENNDLLIFEYKCL